VSHGLFTAQSGEDYYNATYKTVYNYRYHVCKTTCMKRLTNGYTQSPRGICISISISCSRFGLWQLSMLITDCTVTDELPKPSCVIYIDIRYSNIANITFREQSKSLFLFKCLTYLILINSIASCRCLEVSSWSADINDLLCLLLGIKYRNNYVRITK
jgi:hypothetical protein